MTLPTYLPTLRTRVPPPRQQPIRLPSTAHIDARIVRQTRKYRLWREQYLRLKGDGGRWWAGPKPKRPPAFVSLLTYEGSTPTLVFSRPPDRRHPDGTLWPVPCVGVHPDHGPCYHLDSYMVMHEQLLRTIPRRRRLVVRGPTPAQSPVFQALTQEWVRVPSDRSNRVGYHRWICYVVR